MPGLELSWTIPQREIFFPEHPVRFTAVAKGRRFGATRGAAHACIQWCLEGKSCLWGDTIHANIERYWDRYFEPALKKSDIEWKFDRVAKVAKIGRGVIDFRSADKPENWEGFGYHKIILNEAGIILQDRYLYTNAVLPMLMDFEGSELFALGVPKGKMSKDGSEHPFYSIYKRGEAKDEGYRSMRYTSYDNPLLSEEDVTSLRNEIERMSKGEEQQEIYGFFVDQQGGREFFHAFRLSEHTKRLPYDPSVPLHITFDFNAVPYMTLLVAQIHRKPLNKYHVHFLQEICLEHPLSNTKATCESFKAELQRGRYKGHKAGLFYYGDASGKSRTTMATDEIVHNYSHVEVILRPWLNHHSDRALRRNPPHVVARDWSNDIFAGKMPIEVSFDPDMHNTIRDMHQLKCAPDGGILKEKVKDARTGDSYEKGGHCGQAHYYLTVGAFSSIFEEFQSIAA